MNMFTHASYSRSTHDRKMALKGTRMINPSLSDLLSTTSHLTFSVYVNIVTGVSMFYFVRPNQFRFYLPTVAFKAMIKLLVEMIDNRKKFNQ